MMNHGIVPRQTGQPEKRKNKDPSEEQDPVDQLFLRRQVHENVGNKPRLERRDDAAAWLGLTPSTTRCASATALWAPWD